MRPRRLTARATLRGFDTPALREPEPRMTVNPDTSPPEVNIGGSKVRLRRLLHDEDPTVHRFVVQEQNGSEWVPMQNDEQEIGK